MEAAEAEAPRVILHLNDDDDSLGLDMDESYSLEIGDAFDPRIRLLANKPWGMLRGLETLSQLITFQNNTQNYVISHVPIDIKDQPEYSHRGIMIDTGRHFLPVEAILRTLDGCAYNKLNVLHWHMSDAESAPMESKVFPLLALKGAFTPEAIYTQEDMRRIVKYAHMRGVRIIPEWDMPAHSYAFGLGYPFLIPNCSYMHPVETQFWEASMNPVAEETFVFITKFLAEMGQIFPDPIIHLGGDEVEMGCWEEIPAVDKYMKETKTTLLEDVYGYFEKRVHDIAANTLGRSVQSWDEVFMTAGKYIPQDAVVQVWRDIKVIENATRAGHRVVVSDQRTMYLNIGFEYGGAEETWQQILSAIIRPREIPDEQKELVIGAEACLWGELVDEFNLDTRLWLRASAFAERLWSSHQEASAPHNDQEEFVKRLIPHRCRLLQRGLRPCPVDSRDHFGRRSLQMQCDRQLPPRTSIWQPRE